MKILFTKYKIIVYDLWNVETYVMKSNDVNIDKTNETKNPEKLVSHGFKNDRTKEENCRVKHPRNAGWIDCVQLFLISKHNIIFFLIYITTT